jgi:malate dehydrogenase
VRDWAFGSADGDSISMSVYSDGSYGIEKGLICSFPIRSNGKILEIVQGLNIDAFSQSKIDTTVAELKEEKSLVAELLPK